MSRTPPARAGLLARLLWRAAQRDGAAASLEAVAIGLAPAFLDAAAQAAGPGGRALPAATGGRAMLRDAVMAKVLHGWLQNRHQTLFPLAVNLRALDAAQRAVLARMTAIALLADGHAPQPPDAGAREAGDREAGARRWLLGAGADADTMRALDASLAEPPATSRVIESALALGVAPTAYVAALVALGTHDSPGQHLLDYLAARLALPATLVRSANRRYRR